MADYNLVQIGDIFLTDDGLETGVPCRTQIAGLDSMQLSHTGQINKAADGTPYAFLVENGLQGVDIEIRPFVMTDDVFDDIKDVISTALAGSTTVNVKISEGPFGNFDLNCLPLFPRPIEFPGEFINGRISDVVFRFTVASVNEPEP